LRAKKKMKKNSRIVLRIVVVLALVVAMSIRPVGPVKAASSTPVYVLGVSNPTDPLIIDLQKLTSSVTILASVTGLTALSASSILYIDGSWLASVSSINPTVMPTIDQTVLAGLPTVVVRGDPSILANSISGLIKLQNPGLPLIAEGVHVIGTLTSGTNQGTLLRVISGFDYSVAAEFQWADQQIAHLGAPTTFASLASTQQSSKPVIVPQGAPVPYWQFLVQASTDTGDAFRPYGQVITTFTVFELQNSGSTSFKWFNVFSNQTMLPGTIVFNSNYRNDVETAFSTPNDQNNTYVSNGPPSQFAAGSSTVSYSIGTQNSTQSMSYFLKNTNVENTSNPPNVSWTHTITGQTAAGKLILQVIPGWTDRVVQAQPLNIQGNVAVTFATFNNGQPTSTALTSVAFGIGGG
jgi:hypothetical protein